MRDLRKQLPEGKSLADLTQEEQAELHASIADTLALSIEAGFTRLVAKADPVNGGYATLMFALMPDEPFELSEDEVFIDIPAGGGSVNA